MDLKAINRCRSIVPMMGCAAGFCFAAFGLGAIFFFGLPLVTKANASLEWPHVAGVVTSSQVSTQRDDDGNTYCAEVSYDYTIDSETFNGDTVYFGDDLRTSSKSTAVNTVNKYPVGKAVQVYYSPDAPSESVIEPGTTWSSYFFMIFGSVFLIAGTVVSVGCGISLWRGGPRPVGETDASLAVKHSDSNQNFGLNRPSGTLNGEPSGDRVRDDQAFEDPDHDDRFDF